MKKQINQLIALGEQYSRTGKALSICNDGHNYLRATQNLSYGLRDFQATEADKPEIKLYFSGYDSWSLYYGTNIEVSGIGERLILPFDVTAKLLNEVIADLEQHLVKFKAFESKAEEIIEKRKLAEIDRLEAQISKLKESV